MAWNASRRLLYLCPQSYFVMQKPNLYFSIGTRKCENRFATRVLCVCMELTASSSSHAHYQHLLPINTQAHMQCMYSKYHNGNQTHRRLLHVHHITKYNIYITYLFILYMHVIACLRRCFCHFQERLYGVERKFCASTHNYEWEMSSRLCVCVRENGEEIAKIDLQKM